MRKHFLLFLLCLATNASLTAQETLRENNGEPTLVERLSNGEIKSNSAEMNLQLFTTAEGKTMVFVVDYSVLSGGDSLDFVVGFDAV